jgi:LPXTG-motif cell wall-anchored protein
MFNNKIKNRKATSRNFKIGISVLATSIVLAFANAAFAVSPEPVGLGSTSNFAVLAGTGITSTGATTVSGTAGGDMGSHPTPAFTGADDVTTTGTKYVAAEEIVELAKADLVTAYDDAAGRTPVTIIETELGGETLIPDVYASTSGTFGLTGTLTLDGEGDPNAVFIFQMSTTLITATNSNIVLINDAQACNVFWQVGSSATFGTTSSFAGHVFALTDIDALTGATFNGQLLARNGAVHLQGNTIVNDLCITPVTETATPTPAAPAPAAPAPVDTATPEPVTETEDGGKLPRTDNSWILPFIVGVVLLGTGTTYMVARRRRT